MKKTKKITKEQAEILFKMPDPSRVVLLTTKGIFFDGWKCFAYRCSRDEFVSILKIKPLNDYVLIPNENVVSWEDSGRYLKKSEKVDYDVIDRLQRTHY